MREQEDPEEFMESQVFGTWRGHRELSPDMTVVQAKVNLLSQRLQELHDLNYDDDVICELITHLRDQLFGAVDEKIDVEIELKGKGAIIK